MILISRIVNLVIDITLLIGRLTWVGLLFIIYNMIIAFILLWIVKYIKRRIKNNSNKRTRAITFIHPNASDFGGGEKVLWEMVKSLSLNQNHNPGTINKIYILCSNKGTTQDIKMKLLERFKLSFDCGFEVIQSIQLIRLSSTDLLLPCSFFTMLLQILGQIILAFEIVITVHSDYIIDTTGLPFTYFILKYFGEFNLGAYIHYPFISDQMIEDVKQGKSGVHNRAKGIKSIIIKPFKLMYYKVINVLFKLNCRFLDYSFSNSTWTYSHVKQNLNGASHGILYPPCSVEDYKSSLETSRKNIIVSFAQFRPEKDHKLQIEIMEELRKKGFTSIRLEMLGSVRNEEDKAFVKNLQDEISKRNLDDCIKIFVNLPFIEIKEKFSTARYGLHTMKDEHFGIGIVEMMSAGLVVFAHNSAGPKYDTIGNNLSANACGYLANDKDDYVNLISKIIQSHKLAMPITIHAREKILSFSIESFRKKFISSFEDLKIV